MFCSEFLLFGFVILISWTLKTKDMYRYEIMCTGNTAHITFKCFYSHKTARNFVRDHYKNSRSQRILTKFRPLFYSY